MDDLLNEFLNETSQELGEISSRLAASVNGRPDPALSESVRDFFHTAAGTSGFLGLARVKRLAQAGETAMIDLGAMRGPIPESAWPAIYAVVERIAEIIAALGNDGAEPAGDDAALNERVEAVSTNLPVPGGEQMLPAVQPPDDGQYADLVADLVAVRNQLFHLGGKTDDDWLRPLDRLDVITRAFVENLGGGETQVGDRIIKCLIIEAGGRRYALAQSSVTDLLPPAPGSFSDRGEGGERTIEHGGESLMVADLGNIVEGQGGGYAGATSPAIAVVDSRSGRFGLAIDRADCIEELVIQSLPPPLAGLPLFAGCGLLGDGAIALLFDAEALAKAVGIEPPARRVLLIESSQFFRDLLTPLLESSGYAVTAHDSIEAALRADEGEAAFNVIVSDIALADDGDKGTLGAVQAEGCWPGVPRVALVAVPEDRMGAAGDGDDAPRFDAYVVKYDRDDLLGTLDRLILRRGVEDCLAAVPTPE